MATLLYLVIFQKVISKNVCDGKANQTYMCMPLYTCIYIYIDAKDLLRRMLAPHPGRRASLDLVMFHPWLKSCSSHDTSTRRQSMESISSYRRHRTSRHYHHSNNIQAAPHKSFAVTKAVKFLTHGPYPPPRRPYRELALLGQRPSSTVI